MQSMHLALLPSVLAKAMDTLNSCQVHRSIYRTVRVHFVPKY